MNRFEATGDFSKALKEVDYLLKTAADNEADAAAYNALNKAAILLLAAKLEAFCEQILEEFRFSIIQKQLPCSRLPVRIRLNATQSYINEEVVAAIFRHDESKTVPILENLSRLWHPAATPASIAINCKFDYGKHGGKEIKRLFQRIDIDDVFAVCKVPDDIESYDTLGGQQYIDASPDVNALTNYRNMIIHSDETPNVTHVQVEKYKKNMFAFACAIDSSVADKSDAIL